MPAILTLPAELMRGQAAWDDGAVIRTIIIEILTQLARVVGDDRNPLVGKLRDPAGRERPSIDGSSNPRVTVRPRDFELHLSVTDALQVSSDTDRN